jgi:hypothetical protein
MEDLALVVVFLVFVPYLLALVSFAISFLKHPAARMLISFFSAIVLMMDGSLIINSGTMNGFWLGIIPIAISGVAVWNNFRRNPFPKSKPSSLPPLD